MLPDEISCSPDSLLQEPHGGTLVDLYDADAVGPDDFPEIPAAVVSNRLLMDCEQIALGTFSPLKGFMSEAELNHVLDHNSLESGLPWTMPIVLQFASRDDVPVARGPLLLKTEAGAIHSMINVQEIYQSDLDSLADRWFGTTSNDHPGVQAFRSKGPVFVAGPIILLNRLSTAQSSVQLTPAELRSLFSHRGWSRVVAFHTRNPRHRGHEHIQKQAMEQLHADGLFINPVIGPKKTGDFLPEPVFASYKAVIDAGHYPEDKVVISGFATHSRFAGPREAVFTALCRKNMGCSHFIVGRDHTGVGSYYHRDENRKMFDSLGDLGIELFFSSEVYYDPYSDDHVTEPRNDRVLPISGTEIRGRMQAREPIPDWQMRLEVQDAISEISNRGLPVFSE